MGKCRAPLPLSRRRGARAGGDVGLMSGGVDAAAATMRRGGQGGGAGDVAAAASPRLMR